ncbi:MAG: PKD domain-containing protein [Chloroflexota bacterium]
MKYTGLIFIALAFSLGCTKEDTNSQNHLPRAAFSVIPLRAEAGDTVLFDAGIVTDNEDPLENLQVQWAWDKGMPYTAYSFEKTATHTYSSEGVYFPQVRVKDTQSLTDTTKRMVVIVYDLNNMPPEIPGLVWPPEWQTWVDPVITFKWKAGNDPENDPLKFDLWIGRSINDLRLVRYDIETFNMVEGERIYESTETGFLLNQDYYWQVAAKDPNGNYVPGWIWKFTTRP